MPTVRGLRMPLVRGIRKTKRVKNIHNELFKEIPPNIPNNLFDSIAKYVNYNLDEFFSNMLSSLQY